MHEPVEGLRVAFHNCACLTRRNGTLDDGKFCDLVSFFHLHELDVLLLAETGVCAKTHTSDVQGIQFDFAFAPRSLPGFGVGALFGPRLSNLWFRVDECKGQLAFRAWVAQCGSALVLLGVAYAPHAGHKVERRNAYFQKIGEEWSRLRMKYPLATCILMGDMNLPNLVPRGVRGLFPTSPLETLFCALLAQRMSLLNALGVDPVPTHCKGNVLDLAFTDQPQLVRSFKVLPDRVAGSDHFALLAVFVLPVCHPHSHLDLRWVNFHDVDVYKFHEQVKPRLFSLHAWLEESLRCCAGDRTKLQDILHVGACALGVIILGTLFQQNSAFGRFKCSAFLATGRQYPRILRDAISDLRCKRGCAGFKKAHRKVRALFTKHHRAKVLSSLRVDRRGQLRPSCKLFSWVQQELCPKNNCSEVLAVDGHVLDRSAATMLWTAFLESQTSWQGQQDPTDLFKVYTGEFLLEDLPSLPSCDWSSAKEWLKMSSHSAESAHGAQFSWVELCDACGSLNPGAAPPPSEPIPVKLMHVMCLELWACYLVLINLCVLSSTIPPCWATLIVSPVLKPGKARHGIESHRPVSLMPLGLKLIDRMLFARLWPRIQPRMVPWQQGGTSGAEVSFAAVGDLVRMRALGALPRNMTITFVDGQSAFCRPPALAVVDSLLRLPDLQESVIVFTKVFLSSLYSRASIFGGLHGRWRNETGLPQGGALSMALFNLLTLALYDNLVGAGVGIPLALGVYPANAYVDDIALFASSHAAAQQALNVVAKWASGIRMRLNVGPEKTACLKGYDGSLDMLTVAGQSVPVVSTYRYLGGLIHWSGSNAPLLRDLESRLKQKTGQFVRWANAKQVSISILAQLWVLYVQPTALWVLAAVPVSLADEAQIDLIQRKMARMILGHSKRSPVPSALLLLGWAPWSASLPVLRISLLLRTLRGFPSLLKDLFNDARHIPGTWCHQALRDFSSFAGSDRIPPCHEHDAFIRNALRVVATFHRGQLLESAKEHSCMSNFPLYAVACCLDSGICPATLFEHPQIPVDAVKLVSRLWSGGQGLKGGDRTRTSPSGHQYCQFCAWRGVQLPDDLIHFLTECPMSLFHLDGVDESVQDSLKRPWDKINFTASTRLRAMRLLSCMWTSRRTWLRDHRSQRQR